MHLFKLITSSFKVVSIKQEKEALYNLTTKLGTAAEYTVYIRNVHTVHTLMWVYTKIYTFKCVTPFHHCHPNHRWLP